jgi:hypothetical protein
MLLKIKTIDTDGFNGRETPPQREHVGQVGVVVGCEVVYTDGDFDLIDLPAMLLSTPGPLVGSTADTRTQRQALLAVANAIDEKDVETFAVITMWKLAMRSGEILDVMEHEAELFRA